MNEYSPAFADQLDLNLSQAEWREIYAPLGSIEPILHRVNTEIVPVPARVQGREHQSSRLTQLRKSASGLLDSANSLYGARYMLARAIGHSHASKTCEYRSELWWRHVLLRETYIEAAILGIYTGKANVAYAINHLVVPEIQAESFEKLDGKLPPGTLEVKYQSIFRCLACKRIAKLRNDYVHGRTPAFRTGLYRIPRTDPDKQDSPGEPESERGSTVRHKRKFEAGELQHALTHSLNHVSELVSNVIDAWQAEWEKQE